MDPFEEAGRILWCIAGMLVLMLGAAWVLSKDHRLGGAILIIITVSIPMLWAIIAPILRWWRRRV